MGSHIKCLSFLHQEIDEDEEKAFEKFMSKEAPTRRTLADVIMEKIQDKKTEIESHMSGMGLHIIYIAYKKNQ